MSANERQAYPQAYIQFLCHFHGDRDYFECHELLEEYWKEHPNSPFRTAWMALIQAAVGMYHYRRGNAGGARKSIAASIRNSNPAQLTSLGIEAGTWVKLLHELTEALSSAPISSYRDVSIPLADTELEKMCRTLCEEQGMAWEAPSTMEEGILHKHTLRDRSGVIAERRRALADRNGRLRH